jgi:hypothetical protein
MISPGTGPDKDNRLGEGEGRLAAWRCRAADLAAWAWSGLVNRSDAWGGYQPLDERGKVLPDGRPLGTTTTRPARALRGKVLLTPDVLVRHFAGLRPEHVVGLHTTSPENTSRWGAVEVDWHGPLSTAPEVNLAAGLGWYDRLAGLGFSPLLTDSNGAGGYHLLVLFDRPTPTPEVYAFLRWLVSDHARYGLPATPETFPKQARLDPGRYGNWLRLPGRHHTREHWSRVWDGRAWLDGTRAAEHILFIRGSGPELMPAAAAAFRPGRRVETRLRGAPTAPPADTLADRIRAYMGKLPHLAEGGGRDGVAYHFAAFLARDLNQADDVCLAWLEAWDQGNRPPKGRTSLQEILLNARKYGKHAYGSGLATACSGRHHVGAGRLLHRRNRRPIVVTVEI